MMLISAMLLILVILVLILILKLYYLITHTNYCKSKVCLVGKTALVTGGNSGIGYQIVLALAQRGCRVIIADKDKKNKLLENIFLATQNRNVIFKYVDLSSFNSVRELARYVTENEENLDILINNAGIANISTVTEDGFDIIMQVNYYSAFLLTHLVLDLMKKTGGRIIFTSSATSYFHNFSLHKLKPVVEVSKNDIFSYPDSKLCLIIVADIFAKKLKDFSITSNTYHPGLVYTNIFTAHSNFRESMIMWFTTKIVKQLVFLIGKTAEKGAQTAIYLACANEVKSVTGNFFFEMKQTFKPMLIHDKKVCDAIWEATAAIVKLEYNEKL